MAEKQIQKQIEKVVVRAKSLRISFKFSVEMCNFIRGKEVGAALMHLGMILDKKIALPIKRYNRDQAHKPGKIAAGRYPEKVTEVFVGLLNSLKANAEDKGLNANKLKVVVAIANKGADRWKHGRHRGRKMKSTHVSLEAIEVESKK